MSSADGLARRAGPLLILRLCSSQSRSRTSLSVGAGPLTRGSKQPSRQVPPSIIHVPPLWGPRHRAATLMNQQICPAVRRLRQRMKGSVVFSSGGQVSDVTGVELQEAVSVRSPVTRDRKSPGRTGSERLWMTTGNK